MRDEGVPISACLQIIWQNVTRSSHLHGRLALVGNDPVCQERCHDEVTLRDEGRLLAARDEALDDLPRTIGGDAAEFAKECVRHQ